MRSSVTMQEFTQMPPVGLQLHTPQQTPCSRLSSPNIVQAQYYIAQQRMANQQNNQQSHGLSNSQPLSESASSLSSLQSEQMPHTWFIGSQNQMLHKNFASMRATLPNGQFAPLVAAQQVTPTQNHYYYPQTLNSNTVSHQQNCNVKASHNVSNTPSDSWFPSGSAINHQSVLPQYQCLGGHHNRMQIAHQPAGQQQVTDLPVQMSHPQQKVHNNQGWLREEKGRDGCVHHFPAASQNLTNSSQPSNYTHQTGQSHLSYNSNQVQHSSQIQHQSLPHRLENKPVSYSNLKHSKKKHQSLMPKPPPPSSYTSQHFVIRRQPNQNTIPSLFQDSVQPQGSLQQCNTIPVSGHHNKAYHPSVPAIQENTQPQDLQSNNLITGLPGSSQITIPPSTPTHDPPPATSTELPFDITRVTLMDLLLYNAQDCAQRHDTSPLSCAKTSFTTKGQTPSHTITKAIYSQTPESAPYCSAPATLSSKELHRIGEYQPPVQRPTILKENKHVLGNQLKSADDQAFDRIQRRKLQTNLDTKKKYGHQSNNRHEDVQYSEGGAESLELIKAHKKVLQHAPNVVAVVPPITQHVPSPEQNDHVTTSSDDGVPFKISTIRTLDMESKGVDQKSNLPKETIEELLQVSSVPHPEKQERNNHEDVRSTVDNLIPDTQNADVIQSKTDSTTSQSPVMTSKSPEDHSKVRTEKSNDNKFDLSMVQVHHFTPKNLTDYIMILESKREERQKEPLADVENCLLNLFWDGNKENLFKEVQLFIAEISVLISTVTVHEMQTVVFQYIKHKDLKELAHGYHIKKNDTNLPTEKFKSSWLNVDEQPADIESVLAEPAFNFTLTDNALQRGFDALNIYSDSDPPTKVIPETTDCQEDKMLNIEPVSSQVCESKSVDDNSVPQEASKQQEQENIKEHEQQDISLNPEESVNSNEMTERESETECAQVCRDASQDITTSPEILDDGDISDDPDSSSDSQLLNISLLTADDAKAIFKEYAGCDFQKEPSQLCQDEAKVSDNKSNRFCNSASRIKFTCPHMTNIECDGEHFCPKCWEETPLLDLDLEEGLFSPNRVSPDMVTPPEQGQHNQSILQSGKPDLNCTVLTESSTIVDSPNPNIDGFEVTTLDLDHSPGDAVDNCTSLSGTEPHIPMCTQSISFTMPIEEQVCETNLSVVPELLKSLSYTPNSKLASEQTKAPRDEVSPPARPPFKKLKRTKSTEIPAENDSFTTDVMTKTATSTKLPPNDLRVTAAEGKQKCKDKRKERGEERKLSIPALDRCLPSGKPEPNVNMCSVSSSDSSNPLTSKVNMRPDPNPGDSVLSFSSPSKKSPDKETHRRVCYGSAKVTMPFEKQACKADSLLGANLPEARSHTRNPEKRKPVIQSQTLREKNSLPRYPPCKKVKMTKTTFMPANDDLFTPDIVVKKASYPKPHPSDFRVTLTKGGKHRKDEWKEMVKDRKSSIHLKNRPNEQTKTEAHGKWEKPPVKSQVPNVPRQPERPAVASNFDTNKEKKLSRTKRTGSNKGMKKVRFELYGFRNSHFQYHRAPACITFINGPETKSSYTDKPTAKQKVYSQWSSTFVATKKKTFLHK